jgi:hypothetical protein
MKKEIDKYFNDNYQRLVEIANARIIRYKRTVDAESVVADAYLYLIKRKNDITKDCIAAWVGSYINLEIAMPKSVTNQKDKKHDEIDELLHIDNSEILDELSYRLLIEEFVTTLDRCDQIVLDVYLNKGKTTQRELGEHFRIDSTSAWKYVNTIKQKLREYVKGEERI